VRHQSRGPQSAVRQPRRAGTNGSCTCAGAWRGHPVASSLSWSKLPEVPLLFWWSPTAWLTKLVNPRHLSSLLPRSIPTCLKSHALSPLPLVDFLLSQPTASTADTPPTGSNFSCASPCGLLPRFPWAFPPLQRAASGDPAWLPFAPPSTTSLAHIARLRLASPCSSRPPATPPSPRKSSPDGRRLLPNTQTPTAPCTSQPSYYYTPARATDTTTPMTITLPELDNIVRTFYSEKDQALVRNPTSLSPACLRLLITPTTAKASRRCPEPGTTDPDLFRTPTNPSNRYCHSSRRTPMPGFSSIRS
jgi:hypothetical protein